MNMSVLENVSEVKFLLGMVQYVLCYILEYVMIIVLL